MIGKQKSQLSLLDSAFNARTKRSRTDKLLKKIDKYVDWDSLESYATKNPVENFIVYTLAAFLEFEEIGLY